MRRSDLTIVECDVLPERPSLDTAYRLRPQPVPPNHYSERTDRNIGWITADEQTLLRHSVIGVAGCGGMGGLLASIFLRLGIGEVRIADNENFDLSNLNRQYAATRKTIGKSKAFETALMVREIIDDASLVVFPQGITEDSVETFVTGCDVICDEVEFWALGSRLLLHQCARSHDISVFNCNTVGFGTRLFRFDPKGYRAEDAVGLSYSEAFALQRAIQTGHASTFETAQLMKRMIAGFVPELPEYCPDDAHYKTIDAALDRLLEERRATIIATNPPMAAGFLADHVLLHLLRESRVQRCTAVPPQAPGYLYFDALHMEAKKVERERVIHDI